MAPSKRVRREAESQVKEWEVLRYAEDGLALLWNSVLASVRRDRRRTGMGLVQSNI